MLQYETYSPLHLNKTAQRNSQHCTKLQDEMHNMLHNKIYWKIDFSLCFDLLNRQKIKFTSLISLHLIKAISRKIRFMVKP